MNGRPKGEIRFEDKYKGKFFIEANEEGLVLLETLGGNTFYIRCQGTYQECLAKREWLINFMEAK